MPLFIVAEYQPRKRKATQIRLIAQCREILAEIIEVKVILRFLELHDLTLLMCNEILKYCAEIIYGYLWHLIVYNLDKINKTVRPDRMHFVLVIFRQSLR